MARIHTTRVEDAHRLLVERVAASRYIAKSARLRDLLVYLCDRVLEEGAAEIHEQEVGHKVFGRPQDYDTGSDNTVRVHASMLRKRLEQYFATDGRDETVVIEIPKGNYALVFRERPPAEPANPAPDALPSGAPPHRDARLYILAFFALAFALSTAYLLFRARADQPAASAGFVRKPAVRLFWSRFLQPGRRTDMVLDDAVFALYQELGGRPIGLSEYFDRSYLRKLDEYGDASKLDRKTAEDVILRRYSSYAATSFFWKLFDIAGPLRQQSTIHFARDYSFRELKANNAVLVGNARSNPWVEPFEARLGLRWEYNAALGIYSPVDTWAPAAGRDRFRISVNPGEPRDGYVMLALLPALGGNGSVLIVSGTGGSAINAGAEFLGDDRALAQLQKLLPASKDGQFPCFEALLRVMSRRSLPRDVAVALCRAPRL